MKVIFGIGNPGPAYKYTYHSLGILLADWFIKRNQITQKIEKDKFVLFKFDKNLVVISKVYMNNSFEAIVDIYNFFKLNPENLLVLHDDLGLKKYQFKLKLTQGLGGHNGLRDIARNIGPLFSKLSIGIDHPKNFNEFLLVKDYVLSKIDFEIWQTHFNKGVELINKWLF